MEKISLNYSWRYSFDFKEDYLNPSFDDSKFELVDIPHTNKELPYNYFDETDSCFVSCYRKVIEIDHKYKSKKIILSFEGCSSYAQVYLNGEYIGEHKGAYLGFKFDITEKIDFNKKNILVVKLDSNEREEIPPFGGVIDYLVYGGIYREVFLYAYDKDYIEELFVTPKDVLNENISVDFKAIFNNSISNKEIVFKIKDKDNNEMLSINKKIASPTKELIVNEKISFKYNLWDIDNPYLYTATCELENEKIEIKFGFREAKFTARGFYLNGKKIKLRGLNRHQSYPYVGYAMPKSAQELDAIFLKETLGCNITRTSHYPNSKHFLNKCDEIGLLVFTEIPGWQHISDKEEWRQACIYNIRDMIKEGYNHPSIILWGIRINESGLDKDLYKKTNEFARTQDQSRQFGGVRNIPLAQFYEDVFTFNDFVHSGKKRRLLPKMISAGLGRPYLVTEHNGHMFPTKTFDHEKRRQEHALRHARVIDAAVKNKGISGCIGWCMSDYNTHKDFGSGDKICYHGVSDMFRIPKLAAYVYMIQQEDNKFIEVTSNMEIGDTNGGSVGSVYLLTNCDKVKMYKNDILINELDIKKLAKKQKDFKYIPHPPIKLDDIIGNQIEKSGRFGTHKRAAKTMKNILLKTRDKGTIAAILRYPISALWLIIRYKLTIAEMTEMFGKYATNWGAKQAAFKFEGYDKEGKLICKTEKAAAYKKELTVKADFNKLFEEDTYDVARVVVKAVSQCGNTIPYCNDVISLKTEGPIKIIGPESFSLIGGQRAFWVRTIGKSGKARVSIKSLETKEERFIDFNIEKK